MPSQNPNPTHLKRYALALIFVLCLFNFRTNWAATLTGQVLAVETGNQISLLLTSGGRRRVQLIGITPPPEGTSLARISRRHLHMLLAGKFITVEYRTITPNGDILGQVLLGGSDINMRMIETGLARVYPEGRLSPVVLLQYQSAERSAQARNLGLWQKSIR